MSLRLKWEYKEENNGTLWFGPNSYNEQSLFTLALLSDQDFTLQENIRKVTKKKAI